MSLTTFVLTLRNIWGDMMPSAQVSNGKAFEYACLIAIHNSLKEKTLVSILDSPQLHTARMFYQKMSLDTQYFMDLAANAAVRVLLRLEPRLQNAQGNDLLSITIQSDSQGMNGDVRDIVCIRCRNHWEIGISCKHNHHAVKHSRLSATIDFGNIWFGVPCSTQYFGEIVPLFRELQDIRDNARKNNTRALWANIVDKSEHYYKPILQSFMDELRRLASRDSDVPARLVNYLLGRYDFYKVITDDRRKTTRVEAINILGTLNAPAGNIHSIVDIPRLKLPSCFYHIGFKPTSDNTIIVVCDEGWQFSMRIHSATSEIEASLKFDIQLVSLPNSIHSQVEPW